MVLVGTELQLIRDHPTAGCRALDSVTEVRTLLPEPPDHRQRDGIMVASNNDTCQHDGFVIVTARCRTDRRQRDGIVVATGAAGWRRQRDGFVVATEVRAVGFEPTPSR